MGLIKFTNSTGEEEGFSPHFVTGYKERVARSNSVPIGHKGEIYVVGMDCVFAEVPASEWPRVKKELEYALNPYTTTYGLPGSVTSFRMATKEE